ncbi:hypothetical protein APR40_14890 [Salegentibacter salarius]|uniref:Lipoprotein n=1 Tax=Salegentibacter salarius TaxID=435906 RepID=A0A2N0TR92_9FLAO|nr:hypothetical protein BHS39_14920 [Salegentibacter salarius]PKD17255.1 hypothetical protein APR40_14890 [Salegentibacter salarius]
MKNIFYISFLFLILIFSCKSHITTDLKKLKTIDAQKTTEIITQILQDESKGFLSSSCITEKPKAISYPMVSDFDEYVKNHLKIEDTVHYNLQSHLYKNFKLTADLVPNKKILTQEQFEEFEKKSENGGFSFWNWLETNCENGYSSISKPIFNETFDLAYVQLGTVCGGLCGGGEERIYELINGKWIEKESFGSWIS